MCRVLLTILSICIFHCLFAQRNVIQLAAFEQPVSVEYFKDITGVQYYKDPFGIYHYYIDCPFDSDLEKELVTACKAKGFANTYIMDLPKLQIDGPYLCEAPAFQFQDQEDFEKLRFVLTRMPHYKVLFRDNPRSDAARCYLKLRGISPCSFTGFMELENTCKSKTSDVFVFNENGLMINIAEEFKALLGKPQSLLGAREATPQKEPLIIYGMVRQ